MGVALADAAHRSHKIVYVLHMFSERLQILLSPEQRRLLEGEARRRQTSIAAVVRVALDRELGLSSRDDRANALSEIRAMRAGFVSPEEINRITAGERDQAMPG
jgi:hypothetical protein